MKQNKTAYRVLLIAGFITINMCLLYGIAQVIKYVNTGADRATMFHQDVTKENDYTPDISWQSINNEGRPMEEATLQKIEQHYLDAWHARNIGLRGGGITEINDVFTEKAKENVLAIISHNTKENITIESTTLKHNLTLDFYSADGNLVVFTDSNVRMYGATYKNGAFLFEHTEVANFKIIMLLEDGFWRIRHLEKTNSLIPEKSSNTPILSFNMIKGINYYPQGSAWNTFGDSFSAEILKNDFNQIKKLGCNTIRIFIGYEDFGKADISVQKIKKLQQLLDLANAEKLDVIITLFDFYGDYSVLDWTQTQQHARQIVNAVKEYDAVHSWDIKNEPDLDFQSRGKQQVLAWLKEIKHTIKSVDSLHPITVGWSSGNAALHLIDELDYISFHHYQKLVTLEDNLHLLGGKTNKPIVLQEFGMSTNQGLWSPFGNSEKDQYSYYKDFLSLQKRDSFHYLFWTLYDFNTIPSNVAGPYPWRKNKQAQFGLFGLGQKAKKALALFHQDSLP